MGKRFAISSPVVVDSRDIEVDIAILEGPWKEILVY